MKSILKITTETGSVYEIMEGKVRRLSLNSMRGDFEWLTLKSIDLAPGLPMVMYIEPLSANAVVTQRITSNVVSIETDFVVA